MNLKSKIIQNDIEVDATFFANIERYTQHLLKWNKVHNLTGATKRLMIDAFIFDAVYPLTFVDFSTMKKALDIGTGAGFPGLILAMALPHIHFTLAEPLQKRASFLQYIKADLKLSNVTIEQKRVEDIPAEPMDLVTSRAVMDTQFLLQLAQDFITKETQILFYKGENVYNELSEDEDNLYTNEVIETNNRHYLLMKLK